MRPVSATHRADLLIATLAARQHGVVARWQLLGAGVSAEQVRWRLRHGRLHRLYDGVYLVGSKAAPPYAHEMGALLAFRLQATLSHHSAAALWKLVPAAAAEVWVTLPPRRRGTRPGITVVRAALERRDIRSRRRMDLTSPPRTLLDMAAVTRDGYELERIVAEARFRRLASDAELRDQLGRNPQKRGLRALRAVSTCPAARNGPVPLRSRRSFASSASAG